MKAQILYYQRPGFFTSRLSVKSYHLSVSTALFSSQPRRPTDRAVLRFRKGSFTRRDNDCDRFHLGMLQNVNDNCFDAMYEQGVKLSYESYKILYFWNCPIKSLFSKCPTNPIFSTKTAIFVNSFKHFQDMGYTSQLYFRGMDSLCIFQNLVFEINLPISC